MTPPTIFRLFVLLSVGFATAGAIVGYCFPELLSPDLASASEHASSGGGVYEYPFVSMAILLPWLVAALAGVVGLFRFKRWGRSLSLYTTISGAIITPFLGDSVASGLTTALSETSFTLPPTLGPMQALPRQPVDKNGTVVAVGQLVRVLGLSGDWFDKLPADERSDIESMIGEVFSIDEIDEYGQPWVRKAWLNEAEGICHSHSIALEPDEMELVADHEQRA